MMIKICGSTYDHTINYGSCLQAYALKTAIEKLVIDGRSCQYFLVPLRVLKGCPRMPGIKGLIARPLIWYLRGSFKQFEKKYMLFTETKKMSDLEGLNDTYDVFICGGDAVWRPDLNRRISAYYMDYAKKYLFSYGASFGKSVLDENELLFTREMLNHYREFGIREENGREIIAKCNLPQKVTVVADPVLLLSKDDWEKVSTNQKNSEKYILAYATHITENYFKFVKSLSQHTGLKVKYTACSPKTAIRQGMLRLHTPQDWIALIRDAEYVVSESFHATVFSLIYHKKFFCIVGGDISSGINIRSYSILKQCGLLKRMFSDVPESWDLNVPDFTQSDKYINGLRKLSIEFLEHNLYQAISKK